MLESASPPVFTGEVLAASGPRTCFPDDHFVSLGFCGTSTRDFDAGFSRVFAGALLRRRRLLRLPRRLRLRRRLRRRPRLRRRRRLDGGGDFGSGGNFGRGSCSGGLPVGCTCTTGQGVPHTSLRGCTCTAGGHGARPCGGAPVCRLFVSAVFLATCCKYASFGRPEIFLFVFVLLFEPSCMHVHRYAWWRQCQSPCSVSHGLERRQCLSLGDSVGPSLASAFVSVTRLLGCFR
jgi:hypothetical protein